jgi:class 3 adenylate cyclase/tetratricopeptide (TPR) repeat protein
VTAVRDSTSAAGEVSLVPYIPAVAVDWILDEPDRTWREVDGSLVFVDVSGFTALSERLAKRGRVGAEELTEIIGTCFAEMLAAAYRLSGSLLKFGGDALLLLFTGSDHAVRATRSAVHMRQAMRALGRVRTSAGSVTLGASMGVHSGSVLLCLVGDSHREFLITGPTATGVVQMEGAANAGEILISSATHALVHDVFPTTPHEPGHLLRSTPPRDTVTGEPALARHGAVAGGVPRALREHLLSGVGEPEHRNATVGFIHFDGTDELVTERGAAFVAGAVDELVRAAQTGADAEEVTFLGTDIDKDGGKVILVSGAPVSRGDDEGRMLRAVRRIVDTEMTLPIRVGVNRGHIFAGEIGPWYRRTYTVMGDTVNLAARLMAKAVPGQIITTHDVLSRSRTSFEADELPPFMVKGKAKPIEAVSLGRDLARRQLRDESTLPFVGRSREIGVMRGALAETADGVGAVVELVGDAGVGKTRLVDEMRRAALGPAVATVVCEEYERGRPYWAASQLLRNLFDVDNDASSEVVTGRLRDVVDGSAPELAPMLPLLATAFDVEIEDTPETAALEPRFRRERIVTTVGELVATAFPGELLLVVEDAHWMDEVSVELVGHLAALVDVRPWLVCVTRRPGETSLALPERATSFALEPLPHEDAVALVVAATEDAPMRPHEVEELVHRAAGNPLFLGELVALTRSGADAASLPESVEGLLTVEIDNLAPVPRRLLRFAAVLGRTFDGALLDDVVGEAVDDAETFEALARHLEIEGTGRLRFRHALVRDAAYEGLSYKRRRELHTRAGEAIERRAGDRPDEHAELLSLHFFEAGRYADAWRYACIGAERADDAYANVEAAALYQRALASGRRAGAATPELAATFESLGDVQERIGLYHEAVASYRAARKLLRDNPAAQARTIVKEARVAERQDRYSNSVRWIRKGLRLLNGLPGPAASSARAQLDVMFAAIRQAQGAPRESLKWCEEAIAEATAAGDRDALAHALRVHDWAWTDLGRADLATRTTGALAIYEELGDLAGQGTASNQLGVAAFYTDDWDGAIGWYEKGRDLLMQTGNAVDAAFGTSNIGEILANQGRLDEAEPLFVDALRIWQAAGYRGGVGFATMHLGRIAARRGDAERAAELLARARADFEAIEAATDILETDVVAVEAALLAHEPERALELSVDALAREAASGGAALHGAALRRVRGEAYLLLGELDQARAELELSLAVARANSADYEVALTLAVLARVARMEDRQLGAEAAEESRVILERLGVRAVVWTPPAAGRPVLS